MAPSTSDLVAMLDEVFTSVAEVGGQLAEHEWDLGTGCPGWTVKDQLAHLVSVESELGGSPAPEVELPSLPRLEKRMARHLELGVAARRGRTGAEVLGEWLELYPRRVTALRALCGESGDADPEVPGVTGRLRPLSRILPVRVFDCWSHEQDIRRATGHAGHLEGPAVELCLAIIVREWGAVLGGPEVGAEPGTVVEVEVSGPRRRRLEVVAGNGETAPGATAATLRGDLGDLVARACGRRDASGGWLGRIDVDGDATLAGRLIAGMAITP